MNEAEMFKVAQNFDEDVNLTDFNNLSEQYAENNEETSAKSLIEEAKTQNGLEISENGAKKLKNKADFKRFKERYFSYYDDVKHKSDIEW